MVFGFKLVGCPWGCVCMFGMGLVGRAVVHRDHHTQHNNMARSGERVRTSEKRPRGTNLQGAAGAVPR